MRRIFLCGIVAILSFVPALLALSGVEGCAARSIPVSLAPLELNLGQRMDASPSHAVVRLTGRGDGISVRYSASSPVDCIVTFADGKAVFDLSSSLVLELPAGSGADATLDVTASPAWSLSDHEYRVFFFSRSAVGTAVERVELIKTSLWRLPFVAVKQFFTPEPYLPASYHRLKGYRILGMAATKLILLCLVVPLVAVLLMKRFRRARTMACMTVLFAGFLFIAARSSIDLIIFTGNHLRAWYGNQPYEQAGSAYAIADFLRPSLSAQSPSAASPVFLCSEGTSYIPALMTYLLYPQRVTQKFEEGQTPTMLIAFQQPVSAEEGQAFRCGDRAFSRVKPLKTFADGSVVYSVLQP